MSDQQRGFLDLSSDTGSDKDSQEHIIHQLIGRMATFAMVKVLAVTNSGGVSGSGFVDVQPMVHQIDSDGNPTPHGKVNHLPYVRVQGGTFAVILDPKAGDVGVAAFCSRDISAVKRQRAPAAPGSRRHYDWADGIYLFSVLTATPTDYVEYSATGINVVTTQNLTFTALNATLDANGNLAVKGEVTADMGASKVTLTQHVHGTGAAAAGTTVPTPGH